MYCVRESGNKTGNHDLTFLNYDSSQEKGYMFFSPSSGCANYFYNMGFPERNTILWINDTFIKEDRNFIDIGAHIGSYSLICGRKANHTYAFECTPKTYCCLVAGIGVNGLEEKITAFPFALGNKQDIVEHIIRGEDGGGNGLVQIEEEDITRKKINVFMRNLDSFNLENIGCIKIDVEGYEKNVLKGALNTLRKSNYPPILFESWYNKEHEKGRDLFEYIESLGYRTQKVMGAIDMYLATHPLFK